MGELLFVGAGLWDEQDLSRRAVAELKRCRTVFLEEYTAVLAEGSRERLAAEIGQPLVRLEREEVENPQTILAALADPRRAPVALIVPGDPFAATTHVALRLSVEGAGHSWTYLANASVLTAAAGFLGLMAYRFGRTVSLPFREPGFSPVSPFDRIRENRSRDLHTLVLLDLRPSERRFLLAPEALSWLEEQDRERRFLSEKESVAVVARLGSPTARAWVGRASDLESVDFGPPMHVVVVLATELHFEEAAAVARYRWPPVAEGRAPVRPAEGASELPGSTASKNSRSSKGR